MTVAARLTTSKTRPVSPLDHDHPRDSTYTVPVLVQSEWLCSTLLLELSFGAPMAEAVWGPPPVPVHASNKLGVHAIEFRTDTCLVAQRLGRHGDRAPPAPSGGECAAEEAGACSSLAKRPSARAQLCMHAQGLMTLRSDVLSSPTLLSTDRLRMLLRSRARHVPSLVSRGTGDIGV